MQRIAAWLLAAALCSCSAINENGYNAPGSLLFTGQNPGISSATSAAEAGYVPHGPGWQMHGGQMREYRRANTALNAAYQRLSDDMDPAQQLALLQQQTIWLNQEQAACAPAGSTYYRCKSAWSFARASVLAAQRLALEDANAAPPPNSPPNPPPNLRAPSPRAASLPAPVEPAQTYFVPVTAMPWVWKQGGENQAFSFGYPNGTAPVTVPLAALGAAPGNSVALQYTGGEIAIGQGAPPADGTGYAGLNEATGPLGAFPGRYVQGDPVNLGALVAVFTDADGNIIGAPFAIGTGKTTRPVPPDASRLQLGINDDVFGGSTAATQNSGGFTVRLSGLH